MSFESVVASVRSRVTPNQSDRDRLQEVTSELIERAEAALADRGIEAEVMLEGSTARGTWLADTRDIDVFLRFPVDLSRDALREHGLAVGHAVLEDGREEYAEHPYVTGEHHRFDVDIVPCYAVESADEGRSAVDRTPFHTRYLADRIDDELAAEVRVAKAFLDAIGVYGSDLKTRGFSGYLVELLVLEYGDFRGLVAAAADWRPPVELDPAGHAVADFEGPLVVVDPTDPGRNVAAVCSAENVARLQHYARELLEDPGEDLFRSTPADPLEANEVQALLGRRETAPVAVVIETPTAVEDELYPQLDRSVAGIAGELDRRGFSVIRTDRFASDELAVMLIECAVGELAALERHEGPPVADRENAKAFLDTYEEGGAIGPYLDGDRYVVERPRDVQTPAEFLRDEALFEVALGADIEMALQDEYQVLEGQGIAALDEEFGQELGRYFSPRL